MTASINSLYGSVNLILEGTAQYFLKLNDFKERDTVCSMRL